MPAPDDEFDRIIQGMNVDSPHEYTDPTPYGGHPQPHRPGLTKRGKAALGIGAAVLAGGSLIGYQAYSAQAAADDAKAQEIALKSQQLELEKLKEMNRASEVGSKEQTSESKTRQASVNTCVKDKEDQVGKEYGSPSYRDVIDACQAQYADGSSGDDMKATADAKDTAGSGSGGVNDGVLLGGAVLAAFLVVATKKGKRSNPA